MTLIRPFAGLRPVAGRAADVIAPPYDVLNTAEARQRAAGRPCSFLHISRAEIDLPEGTDAHDPAVYRKAAENLAHMLDEGILQRDSRDCYYVYRLVMGEHTQTGLVAVASVPDYDSNRIRRHEFTRPDKEDDRVRQIEALNAQTGPVFLVYRADPVVDAVLAEVTACPADVDVTARDGVRHEIWVIDDETRIATLTRAFDAMDALYVADGHHRSASGSRVANTRRAANPAHSGDESYNYFLSVVFPDDQMQILDYNRVVRDLNGLTPETLLSRLVADFSGHCKQGFPIAHARLGTIPIDCQIAHTIPEGHTNQGQIASAKGIKHPGTQYLMFGVVAHAPAQRHRRILQCSPIGKIKNAISVDIHIP